MTRELLVKVWEIGQIIPTMSGKKFQKIKVGDSDFTVDLTLWNNDIKVSDNLKPNMIISITNFSLDGFGIQKADFEPLNLTYRDRKPASVLKIMTPLDMKDVPVELKNLSIDITCLKVKGVVDSIEDIRTYKSCPGKGGVKCGKKVQDDDLFCSKPSCKADIKAADLNDDYFVTIVVFGEDGEIYPMRAFKTTIQEFEGDGTTVAEKLATLEGKKVEIEATKNSDPEKESMIKKFNIRT